MTENQTQDTTLNCSDCHQPFVFSAGEQAFFAERQLTPPKRCKNCRKMRKDAKENGGGNYAAPSFTPEPFPSEEPYRPGGGGRKKHKGSRRARDDY